MSGFPRVLSDAQQVSLQNFVRSETARVNATIYNLKYSTVQYRGMVPVDSTGPEWVDSIIYTSLDGAGRAEWLNVAADDVPKVALTRGQTEGFVHEAGIGYDWNERELQQSIMLGIPLKDRKAAVARLGAEQMIDRLVWSGDAQKGTTGVINNPNVAVLEAAATGTGSATEWSTKTPGQILADWNTILQGIWSGTGRTALADTIAIPPSAHLHLSSTLLPDSGGKTLLQWLLDTNMYTTGRPGNRLSLLVIPELEAAGEGGITRIVAYRNSMEALVLHMPMPFRFSEPWRTGPWSWDVPGMFRIGGVEFLLPKEASYMDGV